MKMFIKTVNKDKKESLLAQKQRLLQDLKYYKNRIEEAKLTANKNNFVYDDDSSDSDIELPNFNIDKSVLDLKRQQSSLKTCAMATQELTTVEVLQSEINLLVETPDLPGSVERGVWKEVTAECCIDLVPFCITFFTHTPERTFAPTSYHKLQVSPIKGSHETELNKSILPHMIRPSDAIEILRNYAAAYRSRRTTLARLIDKFDQDLNMEPVPEGGIRLKCANLIEIHWSLQNKWSPITPFQHRMKFDVEYMDEKYIKTITHAHKQLSNPELETNERTVLLATIVNTCLEARGPTQELHDSLSSDAEGQTLLKKTTLTQNEVEPNMRKREVMAPPKTVPRKSKDRVKRKSEEDGRSQKRMRTDLNDVREDMIVEAVDNDDVIKNNDKNDNTATKNDNNDEGVTVDKGKSDINEKNYAKDAKLANKQTKTNKSEKIIAKKSKKNDQDRVSNNDKTDKTSEVKKSVANSKNNENNEPIDVAIKNNVQKNNENEGKKSVKSKTIGNTELNKVASKHNELNPKENKVVEAKKSVASTKNSEDKGISKKKDENAGSEKELNKKNKTDKNAEAKKSVASSKDTDSLKINKNQVLIDKVTAANVATCKNSDNNTESIENQVKIVNNKQSNLNHKEKKAIESKATAKKNENAENIPQAKKTSTENIQTQINKEKNKVVNKDKVVEKIDQKKTKSNTLTKEPKHLGKNDKNPDLNNKENKNTNQIKTSTIVAKVMDKTNQKSNVNVKNKQIYSLKDKLNKPGDSKTVKQPVISKIPQIRSSPKLKAIKAMPVRVSPRKQISIKSPLTSFKKTLSSKIITNIPRLMPKPTAKLSK